MAGLVLGIPVLFVSDSFYERYIKELKELFRIVSSVSAITFGFLITMLAILVNSSNPILRSIKRSGKFRDIAIYNKASVYLAGILSLLSIFLTISCEKFLDKGFEFPHYLIFVWLFILLYFIFSLYRFLNLFFELVSKE